MGKIVVMYESRDYTTEELTDIIKCYHIDNEITNSEINTTIIPTLDFKDQSAVMQENNVDQTSQF